MNTYSNLDNWLLDPRVVGSSIMFTKYVSEWAPDLRAISLNVGVTTYYVPSVNDISILQALLVSPQPSIQIPALLLPTTYLAFYSSLHSDFSRPNLGFYLRTVCPHFEFDDNAFSVSPKARGCQARTLARCFLCAYSTAGSEFQDMQ